MKGKGHLELKEHCVAPATEWMPDSEGWTFCRISQGEGYLLGQRAPQQLGTGDVVLAGRSSACPLRASQLGELRVQYFQIFPELLTGILSVFERQHIETSNHRTQQSTRVFPADHSFAQQVADVNRLAQSSDNMQARFQMLQLAAAILTEGLPKQAGQVSTCLTAQERFEQIMRQTTETKLVELSSADLAQLCGCSIRHFSRLYKSHFGRSLISKKIELRLQKAQQLLVDTDDKVIDVAMDSGFQHVGLFTTMFKKRFHVTPSEWRKNKRKEPRKNSLKSSPRKLCNLLALCFVIFAGFGLDTLCGLECRRNGYECRDEDGAGTCSVIHCVTTRLGA